MGAEKAFAEQKAKAEKALAEQKAKAEKALAEQRDQFRISMIEQGLDSGTIERIISALLEKFGPVHE